MNIYMSELAYSDENKGREEIGSVPTMVVMSVNHVSSQGPYSEMIKIMITDRPNEPRFIGIHTCKVTLEYEFQG